MVMDKIALKYLVITGLKEIFREPKIFFFTLLFPFFFLAMFGGMSMVIDPSEELGLSFIEYLFPGILIFALLSVGFLGTSVPLIEMRQKGILKTLRTTPLNEITFIFSQIIVRLILGFMQIFIFTILGFFMGLISLGNIIPFILISLIGLVMILTFGFLLGGIFNKTELASGVLSFGMMPLIMLSGAMLPLHILPDVFKTISYFIPFTYLTELFHQVLLDLDAALPIYGNVIVLIVISVAIFFLTKLTFRWT
ncbi:inner membrane transport permease [Oceanobacillus picturae]|uniref:Transport permease protein n=1 Tax=Oceanobacillus picturae TaxID=171693 RepID=W9AJ61_9BACI|nr:ABC transporter permease [Oceanobacillus picturae]RIU90165.1 ABC transporter permease [Oceanobacillus picturae]GAQ19856.1 inner membrane transport permease [Oceanobacillus picturae]CDO02962.1 inner membrane transport permease [Oceanobacillus picturae]